MTRKKSTLMKERKKSLAKAIAKQNHNYSEEMNIDEKIRELKSFIRLCELDLSDKFRDNMMIKNKLENYKLNLIKLEEMKKNCM